MMSMWYPMKTRRPIIDTLKAQGIVGENHQGLVDRVVGVQDVGQAEGYFLLFGLSRLIGSSRLVFPAPAGQRRGKSQRNR